MIGAKRGKSVFVISLYKINKNSTLRQICIYKNCREDIVIDGVKPYKSSQKNYNFVEIDIAKTLTY